MIFMLIISTLAIIILISLQLVVFAIKKGTLTIFSLTFCVEIFYTYCLLGFGFTEYIYYVIDLIGLKKSGTLVA